MKKNRIVLTGAIVFLVAFAAVADKPLRDDSFIRGVCHGMGQGDEATMRQELGYARRLQLNSTRIWLSSMAYQRDQAAIRKFALELGRTLEEWCDML